MSYIDGEFEKLGDVEAQEYRPQVKFSSEQGQTHWLRINPATLAEIRALLKRDEEEKQG